MFFNNVSLLGGVSLIPPSPGFTISPSVSGKSFWSLVNDGPLTLSDAGVWTIVPNTDFNYKIKMWGAGAGTTPSTISTSGAGGAAEGTLQFINNSTYLLVVGSVTGGGAGSTGGVFTTTGAAGAGYSGVFITSQTQNNARMIAGGGGGGSDSAAGAGGGTNGETAENFSFSENTYVSGGALSGGNGSGGGGGGGNGYFGGGAGQGSRGGTGGTQTQGGLATPSLGVPGGGGGGSGYLHSAVTNGILYTGNRGTPGNNSDSQRGTSGNRGTPGKIYIYL